MHKAMRLAKKIADKEPTPELARSSGPCQGEPSDEEGLATLPAEELVGEVIQQASEKAIRMLQVKHLSDMVNRAEVRKAEANKQLKNREQTEERLRKQVEDLKEEV